MGKLASLMAITAGGTLSFIGWNLYNGDDHLYSRFVMPCVHQLWREEQSHIVGIKAAYWNVLPRIRDDPQIEPYLRTKVWNIEFANPIGLAAGFDKDGEAVANLSTLGFGFVEAGTTTPSPQPGNPYPRVFRLPEDRAIINRYGFNNHGHERMLANLAEQDKKIHRNHALVGVNLGRNKNTQNISDDYVLGLKRFYPLDSVTYFVINISSPNTPGLRQLQQKRELKQLLDDVLGVKFELESSSNDNRKKPLLLKLSPDLSDDELRDICTLLRQYCQPTSNRGSVDGVILTNTTIKRPPTMRTPPTSSLATEIGGLSGPPIRSSSTETIRKVYQLTDGQIPIIGVGGVENGLHALEKIVAGASLVQLYTSMAYFGPQVTREIKFELAYLLAENGFNNVQEAVGAEHKGFKMKHYDVEDNKN